MRYWDDRRVTYSSYVGSVLRGVLEVNRPGARSVDRLGNELDILARTSRFLVALFQSKLSCKKYSLLAQHSL